MSPSQNSDRLAEVAKNAQEVERTKIAIFLENRAKQKRRLRFSEYVIKKYIVEELEYLAWRLRQGPLDTAKFTQTRKN